jgi:hypothetical protein
MGFEVESEHSEAMRYLEKVAKLVPSEILAGYVTLIGFVPLVHQTAAQPWLYAAIFVTCLGLTPVYLNAQAEHGKPKRNHLVLSTAAFIVWAYSISGSVLVPSIHDPAVASICLVAFSLVSGVVPLNR